MSFLGNDSHSEASIAHVTLTSSGPVEASYGSHLIGIFISFNFFYFFKSKYVFSEVISLDLLWESCLEVGVSNKKVQALFHLLLAHVFALLSKESQ